MSYKNPYSLPILYLVSLTFISAFAVIYANYGWDSGFSVLFLILSIISIILTAYVYSRLIEDLKELYNASDFYHDLVNMDIVSLTERNDIKQIDVNDEKIKSFIVSNYIYKQNSLSTIINLFNEIVMPNLLVVGSPKIGPYFNMYFLNLLSMEKEDYEKFDSLFTQYGSDSNFICAGTFLNITKSIMEILSISTVDFFVTIDYDKSTETHKIKLAENTEI